MLKIITAGGSDEQCESLLRMPCALRKDNDSTFQHLSILYSFYVKISVLTTRRSFQMLVACQKKVWVANSDCISNAMLKTFTSLPVAQYSRRLRQSVGLTSLMNESQNFNSSLMSAALHNLAHNLVPYCMASCRPIKSIMIIDDFNPAMAWSSANLLKMYLNFEVLQKELPLYGGLDSIFGYNFVWDIRRSKYSIVNFCGKCVPHKKG